MFKKPVIVFEGIEGSGKSYHISNVSRYLKKKKIDHVKIREPGGTDVGEAIREIVKHPPGSSPLSAWTELLLMNASRAQLIKQIIQPALKKGHTVLCDRFYDSTLAYQGYGRQLDLEKVHQAIELAIGKTKPNLTFLLDIPIETSTERVKQRQLSSNETNDQFISDIEKANKIFLKELGYIPNLFSYPFGEYSKFMKNYISKNFTFAFGQHSGVIDVNKEKFELPRFPINENYGKLERFKSIINSFPLEYKKLKPEEKMINQDNPPSFSIEFFDNQKNLKNINCYSNEGNKWEKSKINISENILTIKFREAFKPRRGRINCSLNDNGKWRWLGVQFIIKKD